MKKKIDLNVKYKTTRALWRLVRQWLHQSTLAANRANKLKPWAGGSMHGKKVPKGLSDGDEGWRMLLEANERELNMHQCARALSSALKAQGLKNPIKRMRKVRGIT